MTSTVLDAALFVLLVGASITTLSVTEPVDGRDPVETDAVATTLATSTATLNYTLGPVDGPPEPNAAASFRTRQSYGTLAGLLAEAAIGSVAVDGRRLSRTRVPFVENVTAAVAAAVGDGRTQVVAVWEPYPGASVAGRTVVGRAPPPAVDVHATRLSVPGPGAGATAPDVAGGAGYGGIAAFAAIESIRLLFPEPTTEATLSDHDRAATITEHRYRRAVDLLDARRTGAVDRRAVAAANAALVRALSERFETELRDSFDSPAAAADAIRVGEVRIVVRRWRP